MCPKVDGELNAPNPVVQTQGWPLLTSLLDICFAEATLIMLLPEIANMIHAKAFVIDEQRAVGSAIFDTRSLFLNHEASPIVCRTEDMASVEICFRIAAGVICTG